MLNKQVNSIFSSALILALSVLFSRILGLLRDRLLAGTFGAGRELDIYFAAFRIPDFVYGILIMGGISAVFLPVFAEIYKKNKEESWEFVNNLLGIFLLLLAVLSVILFIITPYLMSFVAPGFSSEQKEIAVTLTRIMFLSPILLGISSLFSGILQYFHRFFAYALAPVMYNLGIILGIIFLVPIFGIVGLAYGVILGAMLHLLIQILPSINTGWKLTLPKLTFNNPEIRKVFYLMLPRIWGTSAYHINLLAVTAIGSTLGVGAIAVFNFSNNLQYIPIGLIGVSFAIAVFPVLSRSWADQNSQAFWKYFFSTFRQIFFFTLPVALFMFILRAHIVRLILGTGQFDWEDTRLVAASLGLFAINVPLSAVIPLLARAFFSTQDTKTPALVSIGATILTIAFALIFTQLFEGGIFRNLMGDILNIADLPNITVLGLPLALSIATAIQFLFLLWFLQGKLKKFILKEIGLFAGKLVLCGLVLILGTYLSLYVTAPFFNLQTFWKVFFHGAIAAMVGGILYLFSAFLLKLDEPQALLLLIGNFKNKTTKKTIDNP